MKPARADDADSEPQGDAAAGLEAQQRASSRGAVSRFERALAATGKALVAAGRFVGRKTADGYHAVDPDVRRHLAQIPLLGYSLFGARHDPIETKPSDGHLPLVFVHGLGGSRGDFTLMAAFLRLHKRKRSYRIQFDAGQSLEQRAGTLADFVDRVLVATGEGRVDIVAHSLGGLVVRLALVDEGLAEKVGAVITLGSPHHGTHSARFAGTAVARQLRPESPLVQRLARQPWPASVRGFSFWSRNDMFVLPAQSAALEGTTQVEVSPFTHYSYLIDPRSWDLVRQRLERAETERAGLGPPAGDGRPR